MQDEEEIDLADMLWDFICALRGEHQGDGVETTARYDQRVQYKGHEDLFRLTEQFDRAELVETMTGNFKTPEHFKKWELDDARFTNCWTTCFETNSDQVNAYTEGPMKVIKYDLEYRFVFGG